MEEKYKGVYGFKNGAPAFSDNSWSDVELFLQTWDFLPNDNTILEKLSKEQLICLCQSALYACCNMDFDGKFVKFVQKKMHEIGISPERKKQI